MTSRANIQAIDPDAARRVAQVVGQHGLPAGVDALAAMGLSTYGRPGQDETKRVVTSVPPSSEHDLRIGIWQPVVTGGGLAFERAPDRDEWPGAWNDRETIGPKRGPRVVLIGESVARGLHFDPHYHPAMELECRLRALAGLDECEVVDIARTDGTLEYVLRTLPLSLQLEPDVIVVFAGNNWRRHVVTRDGRPLPFAEVASVEGEAMRAAVGAYAEVVERCRSIRDVPVVHVLPDFNLCDWTPIFLWSTPPLTGGPLRRWTAASRELRSALERHDVATAEALADEIAEIDGGASPLGPFVRGQAHVGRGELTEARLLLEAAADHVVVPRCSRMLQREFRDAVHRESFALVDLPVELARRREGALGDRGVFLDYCHLTVEGTRLAADAISERVAPLLGATVATRSSQPNIEPTALRWPDATAEGIGHLCGALYNGRFHQGYDIVRYHAARAFELAPELVEQARWFLDHNSSSTSKGLSRSFHAAATTPFGIVQQRLSIPKANRLVMEALSDAMGPADDARGSSTYLEKLLRRDHDVTRDGGRDVLFSHLWVRAGQARRGDAVFYSCYEPELTVDFYCGTPATLVVDITLRARGSEVAGGDVTVSIGDDVVGSVMPTTSWQRVRLRVPGERRQTGLRQLRIRWPSATTAVVAGQPHLVWGEVATVRIGPVQ